MSTERYGPRWRQRLAESLASLRLLGRRAWLALLGIAVGCAAVVALLTIGHSAAMQARQLFQGMGSELMVANLTATPEGQGYSATMPALSSVPPPVRLAAPLAMAAADVSLGRRSVSVMVAGSTVALAEVLGLEAAQGRLLSVHDEGSPHVLLGAQLATRLGAQVADRLQVGRYLFQVVGLLAPQSYNPMLPVALDDALLMPLPGLRRLSSSAQPSVVLALGRDAAAMPWAAALLEDFLRSRLPGVQVEVLVPRQLLDGMAYQSRLFTSLLAGLGGIALLVGGVGVMNVMLMNVAERRREIGVRMALGARPCDIAWAFLLEAVLLAVCGALLGALLGLLAAWGFIWMSAWPFHLDPWALPLGMGSALCIGVFFGLQPALSAARLQPVVALRDD
ncbi:ABC transporter permease [Pseudomonas entomophila]|uniref:ABC transporter permease n=1 Tax=Pseudomonas entomophila TaxID=312306 RepID=UPI0023D7C2DE|nr:ABC transporter permease [Pseudomonas entomophila]MDF0730681.1 ABC transporter permease [Pseudomonas entomophila]